MIFSTWKELNAQFHITLENNWSNWDLRILRKDESGRVKYLAKLDVFHLTLGSGSIGKGSIVVLRSKSRRYMRIRARRTLCNGPRSAAARTARVVSKDVSRSPNNTAARIDNRVSSFLCPQIRDACKDLVLSDDQLRLVMQKLSDEINRGLSRKTHDDSIVKCFTTYVQDLPNGTGKWRSTAVDTDCWYIFTSLDYKSKKKQTIKDKTR